MPDQTVFDWLFTSGCLWASWLAMLIAAYSYLKQKLSEPRLVTILNISPKNPASADVSSQAVARVVLNNAHHSAITSPEITFCFPRYPRSLWSNGTQGWSLLAFAGPGFEGAECHSVSGGGVPALKLVSKSDLRPGRSWMFVVKTNEPQLMEVSVRVEQEGKCIASVGCTQRANESSSAIHDTPHNWALPLISGAFASISGLALFFWLMSKPDEKIGVTLINSLGESLALIAIMAIGILLLYLATRPIRPIVAVGYQEARELISNQLSQSDEPVHNEANAGKANWNPTATIALIVSAFGLGIGILSETPIDFSLSGNAVIYVLLGMLIVTALGGVLWLYKRRRVRA